MTLGEKLKLLLAQSNLTASDLARSHGGVSSNTVRRWIAGEGEPSLSDAKWLADHLAVSLDFLSDDSVTEPESKSKNEAERRIWQAIMALGYDEAWNRLLRVNDPISVRSSKREDEESLSGIRDELDEQAGELSWRVASYVNERNRRYQEMSTALDVLFAKTPENSLMSLDVASEWDEMSKEWGRECMRDEKFTREISRQIKNILERYNKETREPNKEYRIAFVKSEFNKAADNLKFISNKYKEFKDRIDRVTSAEIERQQKR